LRAQRLLWTLPSRFESAEYHFYAALSRAACCDSAFPEQYQQDFEALIAHHRQLEVWAHNCPENFETRVALIGAEIARIEGRDLDAMRLYDQSIRSARANGFVQNEALANELAARFYAARGFEQIAHLYLRNARYCYLRWGANGKVRQLDELYPYLREEEPTPGPTSTMGAPVEHLDLATVIKVSQAVSGEIVLEKLIDTLMRTAIEHAGAERGLLILSRGVELRIQAEATTSGDSIIVRSREASVAEAAVPESIVHYVVRTQESVILDDASAQNPFSADTYIRQHHARSILCLPLINQAKFIGLLYLENNLAPHVFTPTRIAVLKLLASQAAISLENTRLYRDLEEREAKIRRLVDANIMGIFIWNLQDEIIEANEAFFRMVQYSREDLVSGRVRWTDLTPAEWRESDERAVAEVNATGTIQPFQKEYFRKDGSRVPVLLGAAMFEGSGNEGVAFVLDLSEQKRAEEALRRSEAYSAEAQRLSQTGSFGWDVSSGKMYWSQETFRIFEYDPATEPTLELVLHRTHPEDRALVRQLIDRVSQERKDFDFEHRLLMPNESVKYIRVVGRPSTKDESGNFEFVGAVTDITGLKRAEEMQVAIAREREMLMQQRAADLAKANEALRSCLDALATVPELDAFIGQVMAAITRQLGAASSNLRVLKTKQEGMRIELLFQGGLVMSPADGNYPEPLQSLSLEEIGLASLEEPVTVLDLAGPQALGLRSDLRAYLHGLGVRTLLVIPLFSQGQINGVLSCRFAEKRDFEAEELEIARALATQASLAIHLTQLAKTAEHSAVLVERNRLAGEIHDSLAQNFTGITMQLEMAKEVMTERDDGIVSYIERADDLARFGLAEARRSVLSLQPVSIKDSSLLESLQILAERSNIPGRLRCTFRSNLTDDERLPVVVRLDLLRIAQEAISNALRYAKSTAIKVSLRLDPPYLILEVKDNGSGITTAAEAREGFGFVNMRARVKKLNGSLDIRTVPGRGTSIVVCVPLNG
jgi:PAS domain S-box-containing protein